MLWYRCFLFLILYFDRTVWAQQKPKDAEVQEVIPRPTDQRGQETLLPPLEGLDPHSKQWFSFVAFNYTFFIELHPENAFISPTFHVNVIETVGNNTDCKMQLRDPTDDCHFKGRIIGDPNSLVSVSICRGMLGFLHTSAGDFVIEPSDGQLSSVHFVRRVPYGNEAGKTRDVQDSFHHKLWSSVLGRHHHGRRRKRSISVERHVEVMVVADSKMARFHGKQLRPYILTLMSTVALLYKDPSIGNDINIAMVRLVILDESEDKDIIFPSAPKTLRSFCRWQHHYNNHDDSSPYHHDAAVLLTREDLCRVPKTCDTLGLAQSGMICNHRSSCAIIEDNGLSAAFTIAHELGHILGMPHDDDHKCTRYHGSGPRLRVMSRVLDYNSDQWSWSSCSRHYVTIFLDGHGQCLLDKPSANEITENKNTQPGLTYHMDRQCQLVFGRGASICPYMPVCKRLWCTLGSANSGCRTRHMPWADGTPCGADKWCQHGQCVWMRSSVQLPVDGQWGKWQNYGPCSRICGGGIRRSERHCDNPSPARGGKYCVGKRVRYRSCNFQECPNGLQDYREEQCAAFNGKTFNIPGLRSSVKWIPFYDGIHPEERCKLYCRAVGTSTYFVLKDRVIDGTPCGLDTFDVCVNGKCMPAGCDHRLGSKKKLDICGTCGGDNSTCQTVEGYYNKAEYGYHHIVLIPAGASNLDVRQFGHQNSNDDNYLALQDSSGNYLLNGHFMVSMFPKTIQYGGAVLEYSGSNNVVERINTTKQLKKDLIIMVLTVGNLSSPDVTFKYTVSLENAHFYEWDIEKEWSACSHVCEGQQYRRPICVHKDTRHVVSDAHCHSNQKPDSFDRMCNLQCSLSWQIVNKSQCSSNCGKGTRQVVYKCMQQSSRDSWLLDDKYCTHLGPKPQEIQDCEGPCSNIQWKFGEWSECSQTCGEGIQTRTAVCIDFHNEQQSEALCDASAKTVTKPCNLTVCPEWEVGEWTQCTVTCGTGERHRPYWCRYADQIVSVTFCDHNTVPVHKEKCQMENCVQWNYGNWGPCSASCGQGYSERLVHCMLLNGTIVEDSICGAGSKPSSIKECHHPCLTTTASTSSLPNYYTTDVTDSNFLPALPLALVQDDMPKSTTENAMYATTTILPQTAEWKSGAWSECSVTCGKGTRKRQLVCHDPIKRQIVPDSECDISLQPPVLEICEVQVCGQWKIGEWSECPVTCGEGLSVRTVMCIRLSGEEGDSHECDQSTRPSTERLCNMKPCDILPIGTSHISDIPQNSVEGIFYWRIGHWGECSKTCGEGRKRRQVACYDEAGHVSNQCSLHQKPDEISVCNREPCPDWVVSDWSLCSHTCGGGIQIRSVHCQSPHRTFADEYCDPSTKPLNHQECNGQSCSADVTQYHWEKEGWSQCNVSCGTGFKHRHVYCIDSQHSIVPDKRCTTKRPRIRKKCTGTRCHYIWKTGDWSTCSEVCGKGVMRRHITCHQMNIYGWIDPIPIPQPSGNGEHWCDIGSRPPETKSCNLGKCERNISWKVGPWNRCSHDCGKGKQRRRVQCFTLQGRKIAARRCERDLRPRRKRNCFVRSCAAITCDELYYRNRIRQDAEYKLHVRGRTVQIYCAGMNTTSQRHYITLVSGEDDNYSEIYDKRLVKPETCPHGGVRQESCNNECVNDVNSGAGLTTFYRIGINITSLQVLTHDFVFSRTRHGQQVPYGESGDCYSKKHCPQGQFSINLIGTGFMVSQKTTWVKQGNRPDSKIQRLKHGQIVQGKCGGYCGKCGPDSNVGLLLDVAPP